jgi:two-component system, OmpR family, response regulator
MPAVVEAGRATRVLVVDDEPNIRRLLSQTFRMIGFEVRTAGGGVDALVGRRSSNRTWSCST